MESLSIKKTGKVFLAVALVIFMLVALLGLAVFTTTAATASADGADLVITATFSGASHTPHSDSTDIKKYYNEDDLALVPNTDTFTVTYSFPTVAANFTGAKYLDLTNTGFEIVSVTVNSVNLTTGSGTTTTTNGIYTMSADKKSKIGFDGNGGFMTAVDDIVVVYKLTSSIATYSNATLGIKAGKYSVLGKKLQDVTSSTVGVYVRSTTSITTTSPAKTYDSAVATTSTTFTPAVSDTGNESRRSAIVTTWSSGSAPIDAGDYNVAVSTAANDYYEATAYNTNFTIAKRAVTITADNKTSVYSTSPKALAYTYSESGEWTNFAGRDSITVSYSGAGASISTATTVGSYTITPSAAGTGIGNYTVTPVNGTYTVTRHHVAVPTVTIYNDGATTGTTIAAGTTEEKTFNGKVYTFNYTAASADDNSIVPFTAAGGAEILNVGDSTLTLSVNANYYWGAEGVAVDSQDIDAKTFTIHLNKANITVYLHHAAITYRDAVPTTGYTLGDDGNGLLYSENLGSISLTQSDFSTAYTVGSPVGTYDIAVAASSASRTAIETFLSNYNVSYNGTKQLSVGKLTVTADNTWITYTDSASVTYNAAAHGIVAVPAKYTMSHSDTSAVICNVALSGGDNSNGTQTHVSDDEAAVTLTATFTLKGDSATDDYGNEITANYTLASGTQTKDITITRKAINITAKPKTITYGDSFANDGVTYGTFAGSETSAVLTGTLAYATDYVAEAGNEKRVVGTYYIRPSGLSNNDYAITYVDGVLTVQAKTLTFDWDEDDGDGDFSWVYDGSTHTVVATTDDNQYSETVTLTYSIANGTDVGNYTRTVTALSDSANYAIDDATKSQAFSITKAPITITIAAAEDLVYTSEEKTVFTVTVSGMIGEETLTYTFDGTNIKEADGTFTLSNASQTFTGMLAQNYGLSLTAVANGTGKIGNYEYTLPSAAENTIAKATFTPGAISYSGATVSWAAVTGVEGSDVITFTYTVNKGESQKQSGSGLSYTAAATGADYVLAISFAGDRAANYNTIANQALLEVFSVTFTDTAAEHASESHDFDNVVYYAFSGQTVAAHSAWSLQNYEWKGWKYTPSSEEITYDAPALNKSLTVRATWAIKKVTVTYMYKQAGKAGETYAVYKTEEINADADLSAVPTVKWFVGSAWNDLATLDGNTKTNVYYDTYAATRTFYTEFSFNVKNGDVDGNGTADASDATLYRQVNVTGYAVDSYKLADVDAAWTVVNGSFDHEGGVSSAWFAANKYFLQAVSDIDGDGQESTNDIFYLLNAQVSSAYAEKEDGAVVIKILAANVTGNKTIDAILDSPSSVKVEGYAAGFSYADETVTLTTALTTGQKLEIIVNGVKYVYTAA